MSAFQHIAAYNVNNRQSRLSDCTIHFVLFETYSTRLQQTMIKQFFDRRRLKLRATAWNFLWSILLSNSSFLLSSQLSRRTRTETFATQASLDRSRGLERKASADKVKKQEVETTTLKCFCRTTNKSREEEEQSRANRKCVRGN